MKGGQAKFLWFAVQTMAFVDRCRRTGGVHQLELEHAGAELLLEYTAQTKAPGDRTVRGVLTVCGAALPPHNRRQRWLRAYLKLCESLAGDMMIVALPRSPVRDKLIKRGYVEISEDFLVRDLRAA
jgi:hypothetical protein